MKGDKKKAIKFMNKKAIALTELPTVVMIFVVIVIMIAVGSLIVNELRDTYDADETNTAGYNATLEGEAAFQTFSEQLPLLALVLIFAVVITVVVASLLPRVMH